MRKPPIVKTMGVKISQNIWRGILLFLEGFFLFFVTVRFSSFFPRTGHPPAFLSPLPPNLQENEKKGWENGKREEGQENEKNKSLSFPIPSKLPPRDVTDMF